jgi:hypothetical protein
VYTFNFLEEILLSEDCLKQGDPLPPLISKFALEYVIRRVHAHQEDLILNGTHQFGVNTDNVNVLDGSVHTLYKEKHRSFSSR